MPQTEAISRTRRAETQSESVGIRQKSEYVGVGFGWQGHLVAGGCEDHEYRQKSHYLG